MLPGNQLTMSFEKGKKCWACKIFQQNSFSSSQWIKSQKMVKIKKKNVCIDRIDFELFQK